MVYLILFFIIFTFSLNLVIKFNKKITETFFVVVSSIILILFLGGLFSLLKETFYLLILVSILSCIYNIYNYKKIILNKKNILSFSFVLFILIYIIAAIGMNGRLLVHWDEFSHWGLSIKNMFYLDEFYTSANSTTLFKDYPPAVGLLQYFVLKLNGKFDESLLYFSNFILILSMLFSILKIFKKDLKTESLLVLFIILFIPTILYYDAFINLQVDLMLACLFFYTIFIYYSEEESKFKYFNLILSLIILVLTKEIGLLLATGSLIIVCIDKLFIENKFNLSIIKKNLKKILLLFLAIFLPYLIWKLYINVSGVCSSWQNNSSISHILKGNTYHITVIKNFILYIFREKISYIVPFTIFNWIILFVLWGKIIINKFKSNKEREKIKNLIILLLLGFGAYLFILLILYLLKFPEYEALTLASLNRYSGTYIMAMILILAFFTLKFILNNKNAKIILLSIFSFICLFINIEPILSLTGYFSISKSYTVEKRNQYNDFQNTINQINKESKIYFIAQNTKGEEYYTAQYISSPIKLNDGKFSIGKPYNIDDIWTIDISVIKWEQELFNFDYVYIYKTDGEFFNIYGELFSSEIKNNSLYKIIKQKDNKIILEEVK